MADQNDTQIRTPAGVTEGSRWLSAKRDATGFYISGMCTPAGVLEASCTPAEVPEILLALTGGIALPALSHRLPSAALSGQMEADRGTGSFFLSVAAPAVRGSG